MFNLATHEIYSSVPQLCCCVITVTMSQRCRPLTFWIENVTISTLELLDICLKFSHHWCMDSYVTAKSMF